MGLNSTQKNKLILALIEKGVAWRCNICKRAPEQLISDGRLPNLVLDHVDNDSSNNGLENLQILCHGCNTKKNHPRNKTVDPRMPPEYVVGKNLMRDARRYVHGLMLDPATPVEARLFSRLLDDMAEELDCTQNSVRSYLAKMTSRHGLYEWHRTASGDRVLHFKPDVKG